MVPGTISQLAIGPTDDRRECVGLAYDKMTEDIKNVPVPTTCTQQEIRRFAEDIIVLSNVQWRRGPGVSGREPAMQQSHKMRRRERSPGADGHERLISSRRDRRNEPVQVKRMGPSVGVAE